MCSTTRGVLGALILSSWGEKRLALWARDEHRGAQLLTAPSRRAFAPRRGRWPPQARGTAAKQEVHPSLLPNRRRRARTMAFADRDVAAALHPLPARLLPAWRCSRRRLRRLARRPRARSRRALRLHRARRRKRRSKRRVQRGGAHSPHADARVRSASPQPRPRCPRSSATRRTCRGPSKLCRGVLPGQPRASAPRAADACVARAAAGGARSQRATSQRASWCFWSAPSPLRRATASRTPSATTAWRTCRLTAWAPPHSAQPRAPRPRCVLVGCSRGCAGAEARPRLRRAPRTTRC
jgi:hypothetical protein